MKTATLAFIASQLVTKEETKDLERMFKQLDKDGDGNLSKQEILEGYEEVFGVPISEEDVDAMFNQIDVDGSGTIDYTEFVMATMKQEEMLSNTRLEQAFKMFDVDGSGSISVDEIKDKLGIEEKMVEKMVKEIDENGDGEIQFDEFVHMMKKLSLS
jgi:calcium-dependent protein kinase